MLDALRESVSTVILSCFALSLRSVTCLPSSTLPVPQTCAKSKPYLIQNLADNFRTLYLFTKSDFKTILLPVTVFASIMAPLDRVERLPHVVFWIWLHLLQFCVSNQSVCPEEDAVNKPWRPIPANLISVAEAQNLRWLLVFLCIAFSTYRGVLPASILICLSTIAYNDLGFHGHILMRNFCNAVGYASFELGATQLAAGDRSTDTTTLVSLLASSLIVFTTIHAADFRDEEGDRLEGKNTLPIAFPEASRVIMLASLVLWSSAIGFFWDVNYALALLLLAVGVIVGVRFMCQRNVTSDRRSYLLYNVWLSLAHICLGVGHGWVGVTFPHPQINFS